MNDLINIIFLVTLGSIISLIGGLILVIKEQFVLKFTHFLSAYAAGALLGAAFFDLLPEAFEEAAHSDLFLWVVVGIVSFFLLERFIHWFHHHHEHPGDKNHSIVALVAIGDSVHNFIDGVAIAGTYLVNPAVGLVTTIAVAAHEIPQEIGDFAILLNRGVKRKKVLLINLFSALAAVAGAVFTFILGDIIEPLLPAFLAVTAGFFIYIALSDLIPEIHNEEKRQIAMAEAFILILGIITIWGMVSLFGGH